MDFAGFPNQSLRNERSPVILPSKSEYIVASDTTSQLPETLTLRICTLRLANRVEGAPGYRRMYLTCLQFDPHGRVPTPTGSYFMFA